MPADLDMEGDHTMDWFFRQWVYGTDIPSYRLEYEITPSAGGNYQLRVRVTQSGVSEKFIMPVPVYLDLNGNVVRLGRVRLIGNSTSKPFQVELPARPKRVMVNFYQDVLADKVENVERPPGDG